MTYATYGGASIFEADTIAKHRLGTRLFCNYPSAGDEYAELVYIQNARTDSTLLSSTLYELPLIPGVDAYRVDLSISKTSAATVATAQFQRFPACVPAATLEVGEYGWAFVKGTFGILSFAAVAAGARLGATTGAGRVDDADVDYELLNARSITAAGAAGVVIDIFVPHDLLIVRNAA
jgi:hypothetical protein